jgi:chromosome segregation protein
VQANIQKLKYTVSLIGGIDEEVVKEHAETKERHDALVTQLDDLGKAMTDLEAMVVELDGMMKKKRDVAFRQIRKEFARYFEVLFEGGKADLVEVYGTDNDEETRNLKLEINDGEETGKLGNYEISDEAGQDNKKKEILVGIDVMANPPGKKIKNIQALSGGERTMTSIALVCAILHTNPSPFVVLDEVEAALDEANTLRFTKILQELSLRSQFIVITHNRATMHAADALYGVTMGGGGVSELLSVKLETAVKE